MDVKIICREVCIYIEDTRMDKSGLAFQREREREEKEVKTSKKQWLLKENILWLREVWTEMQEIETKGLLGW